MRQHLLRFSFRLRLGAKPTKTVASFLPEKAFARLPNLVLDLVTHALVPFQAVTLMQTVASPLQEKAFARLPNLASDLMTHALCQAVTLMPMVASPLQEKAFARLPNLALDLLIRALPTNPPGSPRDSPPTVPPVSQADDLLVSPPRLPPDGLP